MENASIAAALAKAQAKMGKAIKESTNPAFRSKYADLGSVMDACLPALNECGISVIQPFRTEGGEFFMETILLHESGESLSCAVPLLVGKRDMQGLGSAMTYARRYGLMAMAGIAAEDDDAALAVKHPPETKAKGPSADDIAYERAVTDALIDIDSAPDLADLGAVWKSIRVSVQSDPRVIKAKDAAKIAMTPKPKPADDLDGDHIPE